MFNQTTTNQSVDNLEMEIRKLMNEEEDKEVIISRIMYKVLLFTLENTNNNFIHNNAWKYFEENKDYFINRIP